MTTKYFLLPMVALPAGCTTPTTRELNLAAAGKSDYAIVIPVGTYEAERYAAVELQTHLKQMAGVQLPVLGADQPVPGPAIGVEFMNSACDHLSKMSLDRVKSERPRIWRACNINHFNHRRQSSYLAHSDSCICRDHHHATRYINDIERQPLSQKVVLQQAHDHN